MAFGITGKYQGTDGKLVGFGGRYSERKRMISSFPDRSIHDVDSLTGMLKKKKRINRRIHLLGCATAGIEGHVWNPIGGWGLLWRTILFHGITKIMGEDRMASQWATNLAGDLSLKIPNVFVLGLAGISWPLSRVTAVFEKTDLEGYTPEALMADRFVYYNGNLRSCRESSSAQFMRLPCQAGDNAAPLPSAIPLSVARTREGSTTASWRPGPE
jgi:hypothetical protein